MANMARAKSTSALIVEKRKAGESYRSQVAYAARRFELDPREKRTAEVFLDLIPKDDAQKTAWMTFGDSLCDSEPLPDMMDLSRLGARLPRDLAKAVLLVPEKMLAYVTNACEAVKDPHSDYALQMQRVCSTNHAGFTKAIGELSSDDRHWFISHILDPVGCRALALPEAD
jgi:hypothetical protein